ncbi:MAG: aspartate/glutamate racemase family protein [SAR202 cluster bacterium]|nr:aspartate/glutamate racemase family protein [SAR202 cluster bacterium]
MAKKVGMVHTVAGVVPMFKELAAELMPDTEVIHLVDEGLLKDVIATGELTPERAARLGKLASFAEESGAEAVMLTCSSVSPMVAKASEMLHVPFLKVDEAMADEAVRLGRHVGVIATLYTTLKPTSDLVQERARLQGKPVVVDTLLCKGAFEALGKGDMATHDRIVKEHLKELMERVDVIVLAQASMARVAGQLAPEEKKVPICSSPRLGVQRLKETVAKLK